MRKQGRRGVIGFIIMVQYFIQRQKCYKIIFSNKSVSRWASIFLNFKFFYVVLHLGGRGVLIKGKGKGKVNFIPCHSLTTGANSWNYSSFFLQPQFLTHCISNSDCFSCNVTYRCTLSHLQQLPDFLSISFLLSHWVKCKVQLMRQSPHGQCRYYAIQCMQGLLFELVPCCFHFFAAKLSTFLSIAHRHPR